MLQPPTQSSAIYSIKPFLDWKTLKCLIGDQVLSDSRSSVNIRESSGTTTVDTGANHINASVHVGSRVKRVSPRSGWHWYTTVNTHDKR